MTLEPHDASDQTAQLDPLAWTNRRILTLTALMALIVMAVWHAPGAIAFIGRRTGELFFVLLLAASLTYLLRPSARLLERHVFSSRRRSVARTWSAAVVFVGLGVLIYAFVAIAMKPVAADVGALWRNFVAQTQDEQRALIDRWQDVINGALVPYRSWLPQGYELNVDKQVPQAIVSMAPKFKLWATHAFSHASFLVELLLLPVLVFYFLCDGPDIRREAALLVPSTWRRRAGRLADDFDRVFGGYIRGQVWMCVIAWLIVTVMLMVLHVPHAGTLGIIAGVTRAIPVIGPLLGAVPLVLVCLLTTGSVPITVSLLLGFLLMHFLESKVLLPKIIGHEVDLHPVSVIVVLLLGLEFFGFLGVFLAVPIAAVLKIVLVEWNEIQSQRAMNTAEPSTVEIDRTAETTSLEL